MVMVGLSIGQTRCAMSLTAVCGRLPLLQGTRHAHCYTSSQLQHAIEEHAQQTPGLVTLADLMSFGRQCQKNQSVAAAQEVLHELSIRLAKQIKVFQNLPFLTGCDPYIKSLYHTHVDSYERLNKVSFATPDQGTNLLRSGIGNFLDTTANDVHMLSRGVEACQAHMAFDKLNEFLNHTVQSRIGVRVIAEHYLATLTPREGLVGIVCEELILPLAIDKSAHLAAKICEAHFGTAPQVILTGDVGSGFPYIPMHLDYMLLELLKNSMKATAEAHRLRMTLPPIVVTAVKSDSAVSIRIADQGHGVPSSLAPRVFDYSFTTHKENSSSAEKGGLGLDAYSSMEVSPIAGLGFGLPLAREYARYFGGDLQLASMPGHGCDAYLVLNHTARPLHPRHVC